MARFKHLNNWVKVLIPIKDNGVGLQCINEDNEGCSKYKDVNVHDKIKHPCKDKMKCVFNRRVMLHFKRENTTFISLERSKKLYNGQVISLLGSHVLGIKCPSFGDNHCFGGLNAWL